MSWIKNRRINYYRNPKIYISASSNSEGVYLSRKSLGMILLIILILFFLWWILFSNFFKVKDIIIEGSLNPEVQSEIESFRNKNILTFVLGNTEKKLAEKQSSIKEINILRGIPDTLKINVTVRTPIISWKAGNKTYLVDEEGIAFEMGEGQVVNEEGKKIPLVIDSNNMSINPASKIVTSNFVTFISNLVRLAPEKAGININEIRIGETTFNIEADTDKGYRLRMDTARSAEVQLDVLKKIIDQYQDQIHEYVDLRVEGRVYYK